MKKALLLIAAAMFTLFTFGQSKTKTTPKKAKNETELRADKRTNELNAIVKLTGKQKIDIYTIHYNFITRNKEISANKSLSATRKKKLVEKSNEERWKMIRSELTKTQLEKLKLTKYQQKLDAATAVENK